MHTASRRDESPLLHHLKGGTVEPLKAAGTMERYLQRFSLGIDQHPQIDFTLFSKPTRQPWINRCRVVQIVGLVIRFNQGLFGIL
jgi:hypothetical protein